MDYFDILLAKKLSGGGGGGEITVEGLTVNDNGTYTAPSGKAYSPVVVNLPLGEKAITANGEYNASADDLKGYSKVTVAVEGFKVKDMPTGAISSFDDGTDNPLKTLKVSIVPVQAGSGDPSPSNPRAISGWTGAEIHVADGETPHIIDNVVNVSWQTEAGTVYGGELDVTTGVLTVKYVVADLGLLGWTYSDGIFLSNVVPNIKIRTSGDPLSVFTEIFKTVGSIEGDYQLAQSLNSTRLRINDTDYTDASTFVTAMTGQKVIYEITTPQTYQLTPTQVSSILGTNNIWADCGDVISGKYFASL